MVGTVSLSTYIDIHFCSFLLGFRMHIWICIEKLYYEISIVFLEKLVNNYFERIDGSMISNMSIGYNDIAMDCA